VIRNNHATDNLAIGVTSGVTAGNGFLLPAGQLLPLTGYNGDIYVIRGGSNDIPVSYFDAGPTA
jgi:hypothetical protein